MDLPGLAMSRSMGDTMAKQLGVIAEPEITILELDKCPSKPHSMVLASDGIWD